MGEVCDRLEDVAVKFVEVTADGKISLSEAFQFFGEMIETAVEIVHKLEDRQAGFEPLVRDLEAIFDKHIGPLDLKYVPDGLERVLVDPLVRASIRPVVLRMYKAIDG